MDIRIFAGEVIKTKGRIVLSKGIWTLSVNQYILLSLCKRQVYERLWRAEFYRVCNSFSFAYNINIRDIKIWLILLSVVCDVPHFSQVYKVFKQVLFISGTLILFTKQLDWYYVCSVKWHLFFKAYPSIVL